MSIKGVFALFGFPDEENPERLKLESELEDYKESPHFDLSIFTFGDNEKNIGYVRLE